MSELGEDEGVTQRPAHWDHSTHDPFFEYYAGQSRSDETIVRFAAMSRRVHAGAPKGRGTVPHHHQCPVPEAARVRSAHVQLVSTPLEALLRAPGPDDTSGARDLRDLPSRQLVLVLWPAPRARKARVCMPGPLRPDRS